MRTGSVALLVLLAGLPAAAGEIGVYTDWTANAEGRGQSRVCWVYSEPKKHEGNYTRRGRIHSVVTHRPGEKTRNQVMFTAGYTHKAESAVEIAIGNARFEFFTHKDTSWAYTGKDDSALVAAMRAGNDMIVTGVSSRGTKTTDTYSLRGFTAAHDAIGRACKVK